MRRAKGFSKVLIANRGEIACRLAAACRALGLKSVAVYSEADANARHVAMADEAVAIGPGPAGESYLDAAKLLAAAAKTGAQAIHPGYGFLSENASFARAVAKAGLAWVGPGADVIERMGNKIAAKRAAAEAGVPTLPWAVLAGHKELKAAAKKIGFPLLLKAANGGGGRGMRFVEKVAELEQKAEAASREAKGAFGAGEIFLERFQADGRHIEVQVLGDSHGGIVTLGERECSLQRRHQKVIEEAPAPALSEGARKALWAAAAKLARGVGYSSAGTCEFLVDSKERFYFLEMNTRLQVEHPVTELVWGVDLPVLQLRVAMGERLPAELSKRAPRGHAIEARLYAEDPGNRFMPSPGRLEELSFPRMANLRVDSGYEAGSEVPVFYDAMLAKVVGWGMDREQARATLLEALSQTRVEGVSWNGAYLADVLRAKRFIEGRVTTGYLEEAFADWQKDAPNRRVQPQRTKANESAHAPIRSPWITFANPGKRPAICSRATPAHPTPTSDAADRFGDARPGGPLLADYPGKVLKVMVKAGQSVTKGQVVVVCESMKMEFSYSSPLDTKVKSVAVKEGEVIPAGAVLVELS